MIFTSLSPSAEKILQEILDNRLENTDYWAERVENLSFAEESQLRSTFKELSNAEMISTTWADDIPYMLTVLNNGVSYFDIKRKVEENEQKEKRSDKWHDIVMLIIGALLGGLVEFMLFKLFGIGG